MHEQIYSHSSPRRAPPTPGPRQPSSQRMQLEELAGHGVRCAQWIWKPGHLDDQQRQLRLVQLRILYSYLQPTCRRFGGTSIIFCDDEHAECAVEISMGGATPQTRPADPRSGRQHRFSGSNATWSQLPMPSVTTCVRGQRGGFPGGILRWVQCWLCANHVL